MTPASRRREPGRQPDLQQLDAGRAPRRWASPRSRAPPIIAATGDHGYLGAGTDNYPAAFPGVTAAGGTTLSGASGASARGYSESAWSLNSSGVGWGGTSGCDLAEPKPAYQTDTGCAGRSYADVSADANPDTGLRVYDSGNGGWFVEGGTSLATPLIAASRRSPASAAQPAVGVHGQRIAQRSDQRLDRQLCRGDRLHLRRRARAMTGPPASAPSQVTSSPGAPGIGGPSIGGGSNNTYTQTVGTTTAALAGGVYPNGLDTTYYWQYGTTTAYGQQTTATDIGVRHRAGHRRRDADRADAGHHLSLPARRPEQRRHRPTATTTRSTTSSISNVPPVNTIAPSISGAALQGQTLSAATGSWSPTPTSFAYQWQSSADGGSTWANIGGATGSTYAVATADLGADIRVA